MTPDAPVSTGLPDLRAVPLGEMPALPAADLDKIVQRALPGTPAAPPGTKFGSSI